VAGGETVTAAAPFRFTRIPRDRRRRHPAMSYLVSSPGTNAGRDLTAGARVDPRGMDLVGGAAIAPADDAIIGGAGAVAVAVDASTNEIAAVTVAAGTIGADGSRSIGSVGPSTRSVTPLAAFGAPRVVRSTSIIGAGCADTAAGDEDRR